MFNFKKLKLIFTYTFCGSSALLSVLSSGFFLTQVFPNFIAVYTGLIFGGKNPLVSRWDFQAENPPCFPIQKGVAPILESECFSDVPIKNLGVIQNSTDGKIMNFKNPLAINGPIFLPKFLQRFFEHVFAIGFFRMIVDFYSSHKKRILDQLLN